MSKKSMGIMNYIALLSIFIFTGAGTYETSAVQTMIEAWPTVDPATVRMVVTLPSLVSLPIMLAIGAVVGHKIGYKLSALLGVACIGIGGAGPCLLAPNWTVVMAFRVILGIGIGIIGMRNALIYGLVPAEKQAQIIGYGQVLGTLGTTIASPVVAFLTKFGWNWSFLFNALALVSAVLVILFLPEPEKASESNTASDMADSSAADGKSGIAGFTWRTWYYIAALFIATAVIFPLQSGLSSFMELNGIGTVVIAGTMISAYNLSGTVANLFLGQIHKLLGPYVLPVSFAAGAIGTALVLWVPVIPIMFVGLILAGAGFCIILSTVMIYNGSTASEGSKGFASTVILCMLYFGIFASSYYIAGAHAIVHAATDIESSWLVCIIIYAVMAVISLVAKVAPPRE